MFDVGDQTKCTSEVCDSSSCAAVKLLSHGPLIVPWAKSSPRPLKLSALRARRSRHPTPAAGLPPWIVVVPWISERSSPHLLPGQTERLSCDPSLSPSPSGFV